MNLTPGIRLGPYEITGPLGAGGMGEVYRAKDTMLARDVAIKSLPEAFAQDVERLGRFEREARVLASLNHPNVAAIHGIQEADGQRYLVLEFVDGETLAARIARGPLPVDEAIDVCKQIAAGVEAAHESGVIHRDLKPGNVMLAPDGHVKVLDFGLATSGSAGRSGSGSDLTHSPTLTSPATRAGVILGTAAYMSPEQARGKNVDRRTDIWSFGCVLYECLTGRSLFGGETVSDVIARILEREPDWAALPAETPPRVVELLKRCLRKDPKARLRDIGDARLELSEAHAAPAPGVAAASQSAPARARRLPWILVGVLSVAVVAAVALRPKPRPVETRTLRMSVALPAGLTISREVPDVAPSPDGKAIVFVAADSTGVLRLYARRLDSSEVRPLPDTDGAALPFWSPDSRNIAFFAAGSLKRMAIDGGGAQILCPAPAARGAAWSPRGIIVFNPSSSGPLMKISAAGGTPVPATTLDSTRAETAHRFPCFLPDGTHFLYVALPGKGGNVDTRVGSLDDPAPGPVILSSANEARYAAPGYLVFNQQQSIVAQAFDTKTFRTSGVPHAIRGLSDVSYNYSGSPVVMASDDGMLAQREDQSADTRLVLLDRTGRMVRTLKLAPGTYDAAAFSPDGSHIACLYFPHGEKLRHTWVIDVARGIATRITFDGFSDESFAWTPDGKRIVLGSQRPGGRDLYWINADGSGTEDLIVDMPNLFNDPTSVTPEAVVYQSLNQGTNYDIWMAPLHGDGKAKPLLNTTYYEMDGVVSPDGRWMAYSSDESGRPEVYVVAFPSMADKVRVSINGTNRDILGAVQIISWRQDGKELYFLDGDGRTLMATPVQTGPAFQSGTPRALFTFPREMLNASISRDGQTIVMTAPASGNARSVLNVVMGWQREIEEGK